MPARGSKQSFWVEITSKMNSAPPSYSECNFSAISDNFAIKWGIFKFWGKNAPQGNQSYQYTGLVSNHQQQLCLTSVKKSSKSDALFRRYRLKRPFFKRGVLGKENPKGKRDFFFQKSAWNIFFRLIEMQLCAKNHQNLMRGSPDMV